ncbi:hypothetical protein [Bacillus sp. PS06]|uniref:hypothetical protein n=1 Tax=Bacillus sp. PS06 TaxID=2764176 RepID=UPI0017832455|nr:hypothetical protein [Bacillus sp. PS06]MBD8069449.1 hypothetical protein [Bacillus sp. PS06]
MIEQEVKLIDQRIDRLAIGIGHHLETLLNQIDERLTQLEMSHSKHFIEIDSQVEGKVYQHCD